jgi:hypothetical protein
MVLLWWLAPLAVDIPGVFGLAGWFDVTALREAHRLPAGQLPKPISWSLFYLCGSNTTLLVTAFWISVVVLVLFTAGIATRITAPLTWILVGSVVASPGFDDEVDPLLQMLTFYLAIGYLLLGLREWKLTWAERFLGPHDALLVGRLFRRPEGAQAGSIGANLALRLLQVHIAIMLVSTGVAKLQIPEWWSGVIHWHNLYPALDTTTARAREHVRDATSFLALLNIAAYATLAWQICFPFFAWRGGWWRMLLLGGAIVGWMALLMLYKMPFIGPVFALCCLAFVSAREWGAVGSVFQRISPLRRVGACLPDADEQTWSTTTARQPLATGSPGKGR